MAQFTTNTPTECWVVAFDIVGFSSFLNDPWGLLHHRNNLIRAVEASKFFSHHLRSGPGRVQFLGDELRIAVPVGAVNSKLIPAHDFGSQVVTALKAAAQRGSSGQTAVRVAIARGMVTARESRHWSWLSGPGVERLSALQDVKGVEGRILSSTAEHGYTALGDSWLSAIVGDAESSGNLGQAAGNPAGTPTTFLALQPDAVVGVDAFERMLVQLQDVLSTLPEQIANAPVSITPHGVVVAIAEDDLDCSHRLIKALRPGLAPSQIALGVARGDRLDVNRWDWIPSNFESSAAVTACRIAAKVGAGRIGVHETMWELAGGAFESWSVEDVAGKRGEWFRCRVEPSQTAASSDNGERRTRPSAEEALEALIESLRASLQAFERLRRAYGRHAGLSSTDPDGPNANAVLADIRSKRQDEVIGVLLGISREMRPGSDRNAERAELARQLAPVLPSLLACAQPTTSSQAGKSTSLGAATQRVAIETRVPMPLSWPSNDAFDVRGDTVWKASELVRGLDPTGIRAASAARKKLADQVLPMLVPNDERNPNLIGRVAEALNWYRNLARADDRVVFAIVIEPRSDADTPEFEKHIKRLEAVPVVKLETDEALARIEQRTVVMPLMEIYETLTSALSGALVSSDDPAI